MGLISIGIGLVASNFIYQAFTYGDWDKAMDRSWFQMAALLAVGIYLATTKALQS